MSELTVDPEDVLAFERQLDPARLPASRIPVQVIGAGKLLAALEVGSLPGVVLKRLPDFPTVEARAHYRRALDGYRVVLHEQIGLNVAEQCCIPVDAPGGRHVLYIAQARQPDDRRGPLVLANGSHQDAAALFETILEQVVRVWHRNAIDGPDSLTGFDARLSNWSVSLEGGAVTHLCYTGTSIPFIRRLGREILNPDVFLQQVAAPFAALLRGPFHAALARYYDLRRVLIDFLADLHREELAHRIPLALDIFNLYLRSEEGLELYLDPITRAEVDAHHRRDARFWTSFRTFSHMHRFMQAKILRRRYDAVLP